METGTPNTTDIQYCATCAEPLAPGAGQQTYDGMVCAACHGKQQAARARKVAPLAWFALVAALLPIFVGYSTRIDQSGHAVTVTTTSRFFIFSSSQGNSLNMSGTGAGDLPEEHTYSDPVALAGGGFSLLLAVAAAVSILRKAPRSRRGLMVTGVAVLLGALALWRGLGHG